MSNYIPLISLLFCFTISAQTKLTFSYDGAGNQTTRILCINCLPQSAKPVKEIDAVAESDLEKFFPEDVISYYPNPVKEELYIKWELIEGNYVSSLQLYGLNGQVLQSFTNLNKKDSQNIAFQSYPTGMYAVILFYKNGEQKSIKIIKK